MSRCLTEAEGASVDMHSIRLLVADDYERWQRFISAMLQNRRDLRIIGNVSDGLEAVREAKELKPDLILLDIGLPTINGIEAARRIRQVSPGSKILFLSETRSADIAEEALSTGAGGYVIKSDAGRELLPAIKAVLEGRRFLSASLSVSHFGVATEASYTAPIAHRHEVTFYADEISLVDGYARCIESAVKGGNLVIVVVTEPHRTGLLAKLGADGVDVAAAIERGSCVLLDAVDAMAALTVNEMPDPFRCASVIGNVVMRAAKGGTKKHARVMACGEIAPTMLAKGNAEGAIQLEHLWDEITKKHGVHSHCGYIWNASPSKESALIFERICAEHTAVHMPN